eukprot:282077-Pelagomonas_calceolata.AAC.5
MRVAAVVLCEGPCLLGNTWYEQEEELFLMEKKRRFMHDRKCSISVASGQLEMNLDLRGS